MTNRGEATQQEIVLISLDSDDEEEDERGVLQQPCGGEQQQRVINGTTSHRVQSIFGDTLDVNKLSESVLRSIVASIVKVQPKPCQTCSSHKTTIQKLEEEQEEDRAKLKLLEEENEALKTELEKEKEERKQLEDKLGRNVEMLEEVTGNIRNLMGQAENETPATSTAAEAPPPQLSQEVPAVNVGYVPLTCPPRITSSQPHPHPVQHAIDKSKSHLGIFCTCGLPFDSLNKMYTHAKRMLNESFVKAHFSCSRCPKKFSKFVSLRHHTEVKHGLKYTAGVVGCHYCGELFQTRVKLLYHQRITHKGGHFRFLNLYRSQSQGASQAQESQERMDLGGAGDDDDNEVVILNV